MNYPPENINTKFSGDYNLLKWILRKYKKELPYNGTVKSFSLSSSYSKRICDSWRYNGTPPRVWNMLHKDLVIAFLCGKIEKPMSLEKLEEEYLEERRIRLNLDNRSSNNDNLQKEALQDQILQPYS